MDYELKDPQILGLVLFVPDGPPASTHCLGGIISLISICLDQVSFWLTLTPKYPTLLFQLDRFIKDGKADCLIFALTSYKEGISFIGVKTDSVFMAPFFNFR